MDDENAILPLEKFREMEKLYDEPETIDYHKKYTDALYVAIGALSRIEAVHFYDEEYSNTLSREMNNVASEALLKISEILK